MSGRRATGHGVGMSTFGSPDGGFTSATVIIGFPIVGTNTVSTGTTTPVIGSGKGSVSGGQIRVGLIADTHGLLRPAAWEFLLGSTHIVHAGDLGDRQILDELQSIAPVSVVRGNNDSEPWAVQFPVTESLDFGDVRVYAIHNLAELDINPVAAGVQVIVTGHSHKPMLEQRGRVLFVNPGSAGPRRFKLPIAIGELLIRGRGVQARIVDLATAQLLASASRNNGGRSRTFYQ